jgi:hypothetical protein
MKKIFVFILFFIANQSQAQSPQVVVKGNDSIQVKLSQMLVNVKIVGNIAYTTAEMHFSNKGTRQMEAELLFPLPEGVSVSRYAIDINGKMREAVPVNKNKGKQVFEAVEHRRVDPGLLEKVEGNNFKTRIYPILPNAERIVLIGYEQELSSFDKNNLAYQLVSTYAQKLDIFEVNINVFGTASNPIVVNGDQASSMEKTIETTWNQSYVTSIKKINYQPSEKLLIKIPIQQEIPSVVMQSVGDQHYFYANTVIESSKIRKQSPNSIGLIWDVSLSCKNRDLKKELDLLDNYFKQIKNTQVTLYLLSYNFEKNQTFLISDGDWSALKILLEKIKYDGGTRFSQIKFTTHDEYLFFTDGLSSLSNNQLVKATKPIYIITSLVSSDYSFLNYNSYKTGGSFINLNQLNTTQAVDKMLNSNLKFLGIKENYLVTEIYPTVGTSVSGSFSVSGISLKPKNEIILLFGYDDKAILEKKILLDTDSQNTKDVNIEKLWAQKKIVNLELQYKHNAEEIETIGKKYSIITQNTSLIVLENIDDYIAYAIIPPAELRPEFDQILKEQRENSLAEQQSNWDNIEDYRYQLQSWWNKNIKYTAPKALTKPRKPKADQVRYVRPVVARAEEVSEEAPNTEADASPPPPPPPSRIDGIAETTEIKDKKVGSENLGNDLKLEEVVVVGYGSKKSISNGFTDSLSGSVAGVNITNSVNSPIENKIDSDTIAFLNKRDESNIKVSSWNPDRIYLKALATAPSEKKYEVYLDLRTTQENNPSFYFDVANYFYNTGNKQKALLVLSNIADLGLENHQLYKSLTYVLRQWEAYEDALFTANQVVRWRTHEPQSHRDLGLTLEDNKQYQAAFDELTKALEVSYYGEMNESYEGIEDIILMDINRLVAEHPGIKTDKIDKKYLNKMPVAVRIILNWNQMDTDIDLHIIEPNGEESYYGNKNTEAGARFSKDFTEGYGPEQYLLRNAIKGKYVIKTSYFGESTLTDNGPATVMVEIYTKKPNGGTIRKLKTIQLGKIKENQDLAKIIID